MEKKTVKISLILFLAILFCAFFDLILSYNYYLYNPEIFIDSEMNVEFVNFLQKGLIPINNFFRIILIFPILLFILSCFDILKKFINKDENLIILIEKIGRITIILVSFFFCMLYLFSGFTWYYSSKYCLSVHLH